MTTVIYQLTPTGSTGISEPAALVIDPNAWFALVVTARKGGFDAADDIIVPSRDGMLFSAEASERLASALLSGASLGEGMHRWELANPRVKIEDVVPPEYAEDARAISAPDNVELAYRVAKLALAGPMRLTMSEAAAA